MVIVDRLSAGDIQNYNLFDDSIDYLKSLWLLLWGQLPLGGKLVIHHFWPVHRPSDCMILVILGGKCQTFFLNVIVVIFSMDKYALFCSLS